MFANSITSADELFDFLTEKGMSNCALFHKEVDKSKRQQVLNMLDDSEANVVVVCTDIAARGLDTTKVCARSSKRSSLVACLIIVNFGREGWACRSI